MVGTSSGEGLVFQLKLAENGVLFDRLCSDHALKDYFPSCFA